MHTKSKLLSLIVRMFPRVHQLSRQRVQGRTSSWVARGNQEQSTQVKSGSSEISPNRQSCEQGSRDHRRMLEKDLEKGEKTPRRNAATMLLDLLLESDSIMFLVGTKINEAHQDPTHPMDLEIRRNLIKRIADSLEHKCLKEVLVRYV